MALPASGQITHSQINIELGNSGSAESNSRTMASTAGFSTPDEIEDWYGYSHTPPTAPSAHSISEDVSGNVNGVFSDNSSDENGFRIEIEVNGGGWNFWGNNVPNDETYTAPAGSLGAVNNDEIQFRVRAYNAGGDSAWANSNALILEQQV
jgi:hypothetical protein